MISYKQVRDNSGSVMNNLVLMYDDVSRLATTVRSGDTNWIVYEAFVTAGGVVIPADVFATTAVPVSPPEAIVNADVTEPAPVVLAVSSGGTLTS